MLGADCSGAISGDSTALVWAPLSSRGTPTEAAKAGWVPATRGHPRPPRNSHGALLPPGGTGRQPQPSPATAPRELGAGGVSRHWGHFPGAGPGTFLPAAVLFAPKMEGCMGCLQRR